MKINMHLHSKASDGRLNLTELIDLLHQEKFDFLCLTDHDTLDASEDFIIQCKKRNILTIPGIELSSLNEGELDWLSKDFSLHILGYGFDLPGLKGFFKQRKIIKKEMSIILEKKLNEDGYDIGFIQSNPSRIKIAERLVACNYASTINEAFEKIIDKNYSSLKIESMSIKSVINTLHLYKGLAIWAHPYEVLKAIYKVNITNNEIERILSVLIELGIDGIESNYAVYSDEQIAFLNTLAKANNLFTTQGSDFHGKSTKEWDYLKHKCLESDTHNPIINQFLGGKL